MDYGVCISIWQLCSEKPRHQSLIDAGTELEHFCVLQKLLEAPLGLYDISLHFRHFSYTPYCHC